MSGENTPRKHPLPDALVANIWEKGQSGNPSGRPKGSRNAFSEAFIKDFMAEWEEGGAEALRTVRQTDPSTFLRVAASIVPKEYTINEGESSLERLLEQYKDQELDSLIAGLCALGAPAKGRKSKAEENPSKQPGGVH